MSDDEVAQITGEQLRRSCANKRRSSGILKSRQAFDEDEEITEPICANAVGPVVRKSRRVSFADLDEIREYQVHVADSLSDGDQSNKSLPGDGVQAKQASAVVKRVALTERLDLLGQSGDSINTSQQPRNARQDTLNVTRLYSGNDSDFMEMTACADGLLADDAAAAETDLVLCATFEQENNFNLGQEPCPRDAHNKSTVLCEHKPEIHSTVLTCSVRHSNVISSKLLPSTSAFTSYTSASGTSSAGLDKTVLFGQGNDDMDTTACMSLGGGSNKTVLFGEGDADMEMTVCLPLSISSAKPAEYDASSEAMSIKDGQDDPDMSLTSCVVNPIVVSSASAPSADGNPARPDRGLNKTVLFCETDSHMEMTDCVPLDMDIKLSGRWPFGKRSDGRRERNSRCDERRWVESVSGVADQKSFYVVDISGKIDTMAFLMELSGNGSRAEDREINCTTSGQVGDTSSGMMLASVSSVTNYSHTPLTVLNTASITTTVPTSCASFHEQTTECSHNKIVEQQDAEIKYKSRFYLDSSTLDVVSKTSAVRTSSEDTLSFSRAVRPCAESITYELNIVSSAETSTVVSVTSVDTSVVPRLDQIPPTSMLLTKFSTESEDSRLFTYVTSNNSSSMTEITRPMIHDATITEPSTTYTGLLVSSKTEGDMAKAEKSTYRNLPGHYSQLIEESLKQGDISVSFVTPVELSATAIENLFAMKEPGMDDNVPDCRSDSRQTRNCDTSNVVQTADQSRMVSDVSVNERSVVVPVTNTDLCVPYWDSTNVVCGQTETELQNSVTGLVRNISQPADDLLTRVKLANSMQCHGTSKFHGGSIVTPVRLSLPKPNSVPRTLSLTNQRSFAADCFTKCEPDVNRTKEMMRPQVGISGNGSRMDLSAQPVEITDTLPTSLVSFSLTDVFDATDREELQLEAIRNLKPPSSGCSVMSSCDEVGGDMETLPARNEAECLPSVNNCVKLSSVCGGSFSAPLLANSSDISMSSFRTAALSSTSLSDHTMLEVSKNIKEVVAEPHAMDSCSKNMDMGSETSTLCYSARKDPEDPSAAISGNVSASGSDVPSLSTESLLLRVQNMETSTDGNTRTCHIDGPPETRALPSVSLDKQPHSGEPAHVDDLKDLGLPVTEKISELCQTLALQLPKLEQIMTEVEGSIQQKMDDCLGEQREIELLDDERKRVAECRKVLAKSQMKYVDERFHRAEEMVRRHAAVKTLENDIEQQKTHAEQRVHQLRHEKEKMEHLVPWKLARHDSSGLEVSFLDATLLLRVTFGAQLDGCTAGGQHRRLVTDIKLTSEIQDDGYWASAERLLAQRLVMEALDVKEIGCSCTNTAHLAQVSSGNCKAVNAVSMAVVQANQICEDIANIDYKHICERTSIDGHRLSIMFASMKAFTKFWLSCEIHLPTILYTAPHWSFSHVSGQSWEVEVLKCVAAVKPSVRYIHNIDAAVKAWLNQQSIVHPILKRSR